MSSGNSIISGGAFWGSSLVWRTYTLLYALNTLQHALNNDKNDLNCIGQSRLTFINHSCVAGSLRSSGFSWWDKTLHLQNRNTQKPITNLNTKQPGQNLCLTFAACFQQGSNIVICWMRRQGHVQQGGNLRRVWTVARKILHLMRSAFECQVQPKWLNILISDVCPSECIIKAIKREAP